MGAGVGAPEAPMAIDVTRIANVLLKFVFIYILLP
jgi:hypothetical protein